MVFERINEALRIEEKIEGELKPLRKMAVDFLDRWGVDDDDFGRDAGMQRRFTIDLKHPKLPGEEMARITMFRYRDERYRSGLSDDIRIRVTAVGQEVMYVLAEEIERSIMAQDIRGKESHGEGWEGCLELKELFDLIEKEMISQEE